MRDALEFGPRAYQNDNAFALMPELLALFNAEPLPMSENCLVLNVWTPGARWPQTPSDVLVPWRRVHFGFGIFGLVRRNQSRAQG